MVLMMIHDDKEEWSNVTIVCEQKYTFTLSPMGRLNELDVNKQTKNISGKKRITI